MAFKNGDREDLFERNRVCSPKQYVPSVEKLSSKNGRFWREDSSKFEKLGIKDPFPVSEKLSEGTKLLLIILTIIHQERAPRLILLEDLDRGLHPRLFADVVSMLRDIVDEKGIQIIATTHNPYLLDEFADNEEAVLIVEKENGESTITTLAARMEKHANVEAALGELWYGGFVGGLAK